ncbi:MAG: aryl-sulfate sulfotransferase [Bacteroidia bacterium]|nr:aryl-sulfate sulfotransferase [Bacteroidia bacterium]
MSRLLLAFLVSTLVLSSCSDKEKPEENNKDRNMFGHRIPRGLTKTTEGLTEGYVMFAVPNSPFVYLINRKGEVVHQWKANYGAFNPYLQDDGSITLGALDPDYPVFGEGGPYGRIQKINWNGKTLWDFEYATEKYIVHHDFAVLPNGNVLAIAYEVKSYEDAIANGRKPELTVAEGPWLEKIIEIEPQGKRGGKIVWEWHLWDHLIQDHDATKKNYGNPKDHPELMDFNLGHHLEPTISEDSLDILKEKGMADRNTTVGNRGSGIFHFNSIKYNAELDQIVVSSPSMNEIYIIDHSITIQDAAGHIGGKYSKGGDFLYRWGNPKNYRMGDSTNQKLFGQHDARWIEKGKPGAGDITVFNNDISGRKDSMNYSAVYEIAPPVNEKGNYVVEAGKPFGPEKPTWTYVAADTISFHSSFISGSHRMKNGNTFINEGARGRFMEVTPDGEIVWEYLNPYRGDMQKLNGDPGDIMPMTYFQFRSTFVPADHPAFVGKELKPLDPQPKPFKLPPSPPKEKNK